MNEELTIKSTSDFSTFLGEIIETNSTHNKTLEEYLRSLWFLMEQYQDKQLTWGLMGQLLKNAFAQSPPAFNEMWLAYSEPPKTVQNPNRGYVVANEMVLYQIADLHRMQKVGSLDQPGFILWGGFDSPTGHRWFNFDPISFLECAGDWLVAAAISGECDWHFLAVFLWLGQIYE